MRPRVLIVEDEPNIANALSFVLGREGFDVAVEADGMKAVDRLLQVEPKVIVLDVMLPNKSGFDILREVRAGHAAATPVLMLTAKGQKQDRATAESLGATEFMTKPFSNAEVVETVKRLAET